MKTMKINNIAIFLFLFQILFIQIFSNYIIIPFNTKKQNSSSFISGTNCYTLLSFGRSKKTVELYLLLSVYNFYLGKGLCRSNFFSNYIPDDSETFKNYSDYIYQISYIKNASNVTDDYFLFTNNLDLKQNITVKDTRFYYGINRYEETIIDSEKVCGIIGFSNYCKDQKYQENYFIKILKQNNITSSYGFSFIFSNNYTKSIISNKNNKYDNILVVGMNETEMSKSFNTNDLKIIKITGYYSSYGWSITIDEIFLSINNSTNSSITKESIRSHANINFDNEIDYIIITKANFTFFCDNFFKEYLDKNICIINEEPKNTYYISCNSTFKTEMNKFPEINFMIRDINYTFTLTYEDFFVEFNQKIYFMLVYDYFNFYYWTLGNIFLKKFPLVFDYENKKITFINIYNTINNTKGSKLDINYWLLIIGGIGIIVGISLGIFIGKPIWDKNRKKRANELADDYEYNINEDNNEQRLNGNSNIIDN